jgi:Ca2+-binding RTX toxin-like protein
LTRIGLRAGSVVLAGTLIAAPTALGTITGTPGPDRLVGTAHQDRIHALGGADAVHARGGSDTIGGGGGNDRLFGADIVFLKRDGRRDVVDCGTGKDYVAYPHAKDAHDLLLNRESVRKQVTRRVLLSR